MKRDTVLKILLCAVMLSCVGGLLYFAEQTNQRAIIPTVQYESCGSYSEKDEVIGGMTYHVWYAKTAGYSVFSVNLTKDSLECEIYRRKLESE